MLNHVEFPSTTKNYWELKTDTLFRRYQFLILFSLFFFSLKACLHVARVSRVLQQAGGHAMLIGVGGSGKQSLAKLAVYMAGLTPVSIVISKSYSLNDFKADLQVSRTGLGYHNYQMLNPSISKLKCALSPKWGLYGSMRCRYPGA